jgi:hypothetical protein
MKPLVLSLAGAAAAAALMASAMPLATHAQSYVGAPVDANAVVADHGDWTLKDREHWLFSRLDKAHDDGSIDGHEYDRVRREMDTIRADEDRMRDNHDGQLTDNESAALEARLDSVAGQIHWLHESAFQKPW